MNSVAFILLVIVARSVVTTAQSSNSDYDVLVELYKATNVSGWFANTYWLTSPVFCTWYGVSCDASRVTALNLSVNKLTRVLPDSLGQLSQLQSLYLFHNELTGEIPESLGQLSQLQVLSMQNNRLSG